MTIKNSHVRCTATESDQWSDLITVLFMCHSFVVTSINLGHVLRDLIRLNCISMQIMCHYKSLKGLDLLLSMVMDIQGFVLSYRNRLDTESAFRELECFNVKVKFHFEIFFLIFQLDDYHA